MSTSTVRELAPEPAQIVPSHDSLLAGLARDPEDVSEFKRCAVQVKAVDLCHDAVGLQVVVPTTCPASGLMPECLSVEC